MDVLAGTLRDKKFAVAALSREIRGEQKRDEMCEELLAAGRTGKARKDDDSWGAFATDLW